MANKFLHPAAFILFLGLGLFTRTFAQLPSLTNDDISERRLEKTVPAPSTAIQPSESKTAERTASAPIMPFQSMAFETLKSLNGSGKTIFANMLAATSTVNSFRAEVQITGLPQDKRNYSMQIEFAKPDRIHIKFDDMEAISIAGIAYVKQKGQGWQKTERANVAGSEISTNPEDLKKMVEFFLSQMKINAQLIRNETLDGASTDLYQFTIDGMQSKGSGASASESLGFKAWIGSTDNLLRKVSFTAPDNQIQINARIYDYNQPIEINAPI